MSATVILETGARLPIVGRIGVTRQDNDLLKPDSTQNAYSTSATLPPAKVVHRELAFASEGTSAGRKQYGQLPASLDDSGVEVMPRALMQVQGYDPATGYTVQLFGGNKSFYTALGDKKLADLNLDEFNHYWTADNIFDGLGRAADAWPLGYCYELFDRGKGRPTQGVPSDGNGAGFETLDPFAGECYVSVFGRMLFEQIITQAGFSWRGSIPESFDRLTVPATKPFGYSQATRDRYAVLATWRHSAKTRYLYTDDFDVPAPSNYTGATPAKLGDLAEFDASNCSAPVKVAGFYNIGVKMPIALECETTLPGKVVAYLRLWVNDKIITTDFIRTGSGAADTLEARFENIQLNAGDVVRGTLRGEGESGTGGLGPYSPKWYWGAWLNTDGPDHDITETGFQFEVTLLEPFPPGGLVHLADWVPDLTQKDFIRFVTSTYSLQQRPDPYLDVIEFAPVAGLLDRLGAAEVWDGRIDYARRPKVSYQFSGYAQKNWLRWKEDKANGDAAAGLGDAPLACPDTSLDPTRDLLKQPFAASPAGAAGLLLLPRWKQKEGSDPAEYDEQTIEPRVVLRSRTRTRFVRRPGLVSLPVAVPVAYFVADASTEADDLDFARTLAPKYYAVLSAALAAPRTLKPYVRLSPDDVVNFNQLDPVWIEAEGSFFYKNKIEQYEAGASTTAVELIRLLI